MLQGVLAREIEILSDTGRQKYVPMLMESFDSILQLVQGETVKNIASCIVAELQKSPHSLDHLGWDISFDCRQVYLRLSLNGAVSEYQLY
jgi:hypothetical protein